MSTQPNPDPSSKDKFALMFISSWWSVDSLVNLIDKETGFKSPYIRVRMKRGRATGQAYVVVPESCVEKLECLSVRGVYFRRAVFRHVETEEGCRGLFLVRPKEGNSVMIKTVLDVITQLHQFGLVDKDKCVLNRRNMLFVNSSLEECQIIHAFVNNAPYEFRRNVSYVIAPFIKPRSPNATLEGGF